MLRRIVPAVAATTGLILAWVLLWPAQFGGRAYWLVVEGTDLAPYYTDGDLLIAHERAEYAQGSLVATDGGDGPVLGLAGETATDVLGAPWLHLDGVGDFVTGVASVALSWPFLAAVVLLSLTSLLARRRRSKVGVRQHQSTVEESRHALAS